MICLYLLVNHHEAKLKVFITEPKPDKIVIELSELLKDAQQKIGQLNCVQGSKADSGGWCSSISGANSTEHLTDTAIVRYLSDLLKGNLINSLKLLISRKNSFVLFK